MNTEQDWLEAARLAFARRYYEQQCRERFLAMTFIADCWRGKEDLADRPFVSRWAVPCATQAEQHEPQRAA